MNAPAKRLDRDGVRALFDLRSAANAATGGGYSEDPYPIWHRLREQAPVHAGVLHELTGYAGPAYFMGLPEPDRPHFTVFSYKACDEAFRDEERFASWAGSFGPGGRTRKIQIEDTLLCMGGKEHRTYRALVQPSFAPAKMRWWMENWITTSVNQLIDNFIDDGHADLNVDFCAAIPLLTITGSFGIDESQALALRQSVQPDTSDGIDQYIAILQPVIDARRNHPADDLISVLVDSEITDEDGVKHRLTDFEIHRFALLLLAAGSGTTWKQMGITLAALLNRPQLLDEVRTDRTLLRGAIEESLRWMPTDPMFARWATRDTEFYGHRMPAGSVLHLGVGAASRDPARWERPDEYDPRRPLLPGLGFGSGPHTCLGMHVARAEMTTAINAILDRLPNLRLDPNAAPPRYIGMYERGATEIPVVFG
jgi:cytochrome P450